MPIARQTLAGIADTYVSTMTSIRGRRVHRILMRQFTRFDHVLPAVAEDGTAALFALSEDGRAALCRTDGRGAAADIVEWARLSGASVTTAYDLLKDSLPVVRWTVWHPGFARVGGALSVSGAGLPTDEHERIAEILGGVGR